MKATANDAYSSSVWASNYKRLSSWRPSALGKLSCHRFSRVSDDPDITTHTVCDLQSLFGDRQHGQPTGMSS